MSATVYFSPVITPEKVLDMFRLVDKTLPGNIAIKLHSGEKGNQNFLGPEFWKPVIDYVGGTVVECNTAYDGARNTTEKHCKLMDEHGWSRCFTVDLLGAERPDLRYRECQSASVGCHSERIPHRVVYPDGCGRQSR